MTRVGRQRSIKVYQPLKAPDDRIESKFEPLTDVEINPKDEFWVNPDALD